MRTESLPALSSTLGEAVSPFPLRVRTPFQHHLLPTWAPPHGAPHPRPPALCRPNVEFAGPLVF